MTWEADALIDRRRLRRQLGLWRAGAVLALVVAALVAVGRFGPEGLVGGPHVARLNVEGVITENRQLDRALLDVRDDDDVRALIVRINSPGGTTYGGEALYTNLRRVAEKKPVVAVIGTLGASAGYLVALAADRIYVRETTLTGSIGVIFQTAEFSGLLEKVGVSSEAITSAPLKDEPSPFRRLSPEGRTAIRDTVEATHSWFVGLVAERRKLPAEKATTLADGRIYTGRDAVREQLADAFGGELEARDWLASARGVDRDLPVRNIRLRDSEDGLAGLGAIVRKVFFAEPLTLDGLISVWQPR